MTIVLFLLLGIVAYLGYQNHRLHRALNFSEQRLVQCILNASVNQQAELAFTSPVKPLSSISNQDDNDATGTCIE